MAQIKIMVRGPVFSFPDFNNWCDTAKHKFRIAGLKDYEVLCVDDRGRACISGKEFMRARDDGSFPVNAYKIRL